MERLDTSYSKTRQLSAIEDDTEPVHVLGPRPGATLVLGARQAGDGLDSL